MKFYPRFKMPRKLGPNTYWKIRIAMGYSKQGSVMTNLEPRKRRTIKNMFYPCNRWGVGWHINKGKL